MKRKLLFAIVALMCSVGTWAETDYTSLMSSDWTGSNGNFGGGKERYQGANYGTGKIMYQSFTAPADGIYEIKFYAVTSCTADRYTGSLYGDNIAQAYATAGNNKATVAMTVINQTGCTLVEAANIRTLSVEAAEGETIEYGLENIATGGNWYTIKELSAKMKTVAEIFQAQYNEAYAIWENSTENEVGAKATFKTYVDALNTAMSGTLADAQTASDNLAAALVTYESKSYPVKGSGVKYDFTSKMNMAINAWTCSQGNGPAQYGFTGATETYGNTNAGEVMYQTITGLANGEYEIHFYAVANAANGGGVEGTTTTIYANDKESVVDVITQSSCTPSDYERTFTVMVKDGTIKYGIKNTAAAGNWYICKNVALYMTGAPDLSDYYEAIAEKLTLANDIKNSPMNVDVASALQDAIDATEGYSNITVTSTLETMSDDLTTAINNANTSISNYTDALAILNAAISLDTEGQTIYAANGTVAALQTSYTNRTLVAVTSEQEAECAAVLTNYAAWIDLHNYAYALLQVNNDAPTAHSTLESAYNDQTTAVGSATTASDIATATSTLKSAMITYAGDANPSGDGAQFDLTFMLTNPDLTGLPTWRGADGWAGENSGNSQVMQSNDVQSTDGKNYFYEFWSKDPYDNGKFNLYLTVELPAGTYQMECFAFAQCAANSSTAGQTPAANGVSFSANDIDGSYITSSNLTEASLTFVNNTTQNVKIGLKAQTGNNRTWMGIGYVKLFKVPTAAPVELNESAAYDYTYEGAATAKLTRAIYAGFNTVMLPFSLSASEITTVFGEGTLYGFTGADGGSLNFATSESLLPNTPYLFKANEDKNLNAVEIEARTFVAASAALCSTAGEDYNLVGTYIPYAKNADSNPIVAGRDYVLGADNNFHKTTVKNALNAFRAYIQANEDTPSGDVKLMINIDGEETAISSIDGENVQKTEIYNLAGQRMSKVQRGVNIINGKKVLVK